MTDQDDQFEIVGKPGACEIKAPWGTLHIYEDQISGLQTLWLPNMSMSPSMARDLARHLELAAENSIEQEHR